MTAKGPGFRGGRGRLRLSSLRPATRKFRLENMAKAPRKGVSFADFEKGLSPTLAGGDFRRLAGALATAAKAKRTVIFMLGAHVIKVGLSDVIIELMKRRVVGALALNGAGAIHDFELAFGGATSEDVDRELAKGTFGMSRETGEFFARALAANPLCGFGEAAGLEMERRRLKFRKHSLLWNCRRLGIPATVHVSIGADVIHQHPSAIGEDIGRGSLADFRKFCGVVAKLEGGAVLNIGSAVMLPEVFLKAVSVARNLGHRVRRFTAANLDMIQHYRPATNVVRRPTALGGDGMLLTGHHELLVPMLAQAVIERL